MIIKQNMMKKIIFSIMVLMIPLLSHSQQKINYTNGKCVNGKCVNGKGTYDFNNGDKYTGVFSDGQFSGQGTYIYKSGDSYSGAWSNHQMNGYGVYDGVNYRYDGEWLNNQQHGQGSIAFRTGKRAGDSYKGPFVSNRPQGKGMYTYRPNIEKVRYEGAFENGKFNGQGVLTYKNGSEDRGMWKDDVFQGTQIGEYNKQPVLKKGDTIVTYNNRYLLSQQSVAGRDGYVADINVSIKKGTFIIEKDVYGKTAAIGYITHSGKEPDARNPGSIAQVAVNAKDCHFYPKNETNRIKIGEMQTSGYNNNKLPVYKANNVIIVTIPTPDGTDEEKYLFAYQPLQKSFDNTLTRYFIIYEGENVRFNGKKLTGENKRNLIGWINHDNKNDYRFIQYDNNPAKIPGLNYFGSVYIGDNNPENANGTPNFDIPAQDEVDEAAKEHDICYDNNGLKGAAGVFLTSKGLHCDLDLASACLSELGIDKVESFSINNYSINTEYQSIFSNAFDISEGRLPRIFYMNKNTTDRAILVMGLFSAVSVIKINTDVITDLGNIPKVNIPNELDQYFSKNSNFDNIYQLNDFGIEIFDAGLKLGIDGMQYFKIVDLEKYEKAIKDGKFVFQGKNGEKIYKLTFQGGTKGNISPELIKNAKNFNKLASGVNVISKALPLTSAVSAVNTYNEYKKGDISATEATIDLVFTGVTFIPPYGWAISGAYFLVKAGKNYYDENPEQLKRLSDLQGTAFYKF
jgi:hypothetical protein